MLGGQRPVDARLGGGPRVLREVRSLGEILGAGSQRPIRQVTDQLLERIYPGHEALAIEREGRVIGGEREDRLLQDGARIHGLVHLVPGDAMGRLLVEDGPRGRVEPGVPRQRAVVKIDGAQTGQRQDACRDKGEVGDTEQVVDGPTIHRREQVVLARDPGDLLFLGPVLDHIVGGHDRLDRVLVAQERLRAGDDERSVSQNECAERQESGLNVMG